MNITSPTLRVPLTEQEYGAQMLALARSEGKRPGKWPMTAPCMARDDGKAGSTQKGRGLVARLEVLRLVASGTVSPSQIAKARGLGQQSSQGNLLRRMALEGYLHRSGGVWAVTCNGYELMREYRHV